MKLNTLVIKYTDILIFSFAHIIYPRQMIMLFKCHFKYLTIFLITGFFPQYNGNIAHTNEIRNFSSILLKNWEFLWYFVKNWKNCMTIGLHFSPIFNTAPLKFPISWVTVMFPKIWEKTLTIHLILMNL